MFTKKYLFEIKEQELPGKGYKSKLGLDFAEGKVQTRFTLNSSLPL